MVNGHFDYIDACMRACDKAHVLIYRCVGVYINHRSTGDMDGCLPSSQFWTPTRIHVANVDSPCDSLRAFTLLAYDLYYLCYSYIK